jgi:DNA polymerase III epsilon subunit-like protein
MYLFFDTETTGLPKSWKAPVTDLNNWPRLVQIAWIFYDKDGINIRSGNHIIKPEGFTIPADSSNIHGITTQRAEEEGIALQSALEDFQQNLSEATYLIAHNISFDEKIVGAEFLRKNITNDLSAKRKICTMESSTDFCAIDGPYGYKWPKLQERKIRSPSFVNLTVLRDMLVGWKLADMIVTFGSIDINMGEVDR